MFIYLYFCYNLFDLVIFFATYVFGHKGEITVLEKELGHYNLILCLTSTFFQSEEGMRQTNKTPTIKQDEFHRIFSVSLCNCVNMQLPRPIQDGLDQFQANVGWPTLKLRLKLT